MVIPKDHKLFGFGYDELYDVVDVHDNVTLSQLITEQHLANYKGLGTNDLGCWLLGFSTKYSTLQECPESFVRAETKRFVTQLDNH